MTPELRVKVIDKLKKFLNREPHENEIMNAQNDSTLMNWISQDDAIAQKSKIDTLKNDIDKLKNKSIV